jgi:hypothetical protein
VTRRRPDPVDPDAVLRELLDECRAGVRTCFQIGQEDDYAETRMEAMKVAARLTKASLALAAALNKTAPQFTHRIIVERAASPTTLPLISGKTIPGVPAQEAPQD